MTRRLWIKIAGYLVALVLSLGIAISGYTAVWLLLRFISFLGNPL